MTADLDQVQYAELAAVERRTITTLVLSQAVGALGVTIGITTAALLAYEVSGSKQQAGLAQTSQVIGAAIFAWVLAAVMSRAGRRPGLAVGYLLGALGGGLAVLAGVIDSMVLLLAGSTLLGATSAAGYAARYAATDLAKPRTRARSLAIVVWATTIGAVAGPNLAGPSAHWARVVGIPELTGPFALGAIGMVIAAAVVWVRLRPDPLLVARREAGQSADTGGSSWSRTLAVVRERPAVTAAILGLAAAHAVMVGVMVMTPLHMEAGGADLEIIGVVISVHVLGMFAFAPLVGMLADAIGRPPVMGIGGVLLLVSLMLGAAAPMGSSWQIFSGLFLLGLGWSFATVAASTMLADHVPLNARTDVQGTADLLMNAAAAVAGGLSGVIVGYWDFHVLALLTIVLAVLVVLSALLGHRWARVEQIV